MKLVMTFSGPNIGTALIRALKRLPSSRMPMVPICAGLPVHMARVPGQWGQTAPLLVLREAFLPAEHVAVLGEHLRLRPVRLDDRVLGVDERDADVDVLDHRPVQHFTFSQSFFQLGAVVDVDHHHAPCRYRLFRAAAGTGHHSDVDRFLILEDGERASPFARLAADELVQARSKVKCSSETRKLSMVSPVGGGIAPRQGGPRGSPSGRFPAGPR